MSGTGARGTGADPELMRLARLASVDQTIALPYWSAETRSLGRDSLALTGALIEADAHGGASGLAAIRFQFWRDALEAAVEGKSVPPHPAARGMVRLVSGRKVTSGDLSQLMAAAERRTKNGPELFAVLIGLLLKAVGEEGGTHWQDASIRAVGHGDLGPKAAGAAVRAALAPLQPFAPHTAPIAAGLLTTPRTDLSEAGRRLRQFRTVLVGR